MERSLTLIALFAALIAALGLVPKFDLAFGVPITAQSMGVMLCGTVLGAKRGGLAALLFVGLVALGLPLLAGARGGLGVFASPTAGFVIGFPIAAFVTGLAMQQFRALPIGWAAGVVLAADGTKEVTVNITGVSNAATQSEQAARQVSDSANQLAQQADRLKNEIGEFLKKIASD